MKNGRRKAARKIFRRDEANRVIGLAETKDSFKAVRYGIGPGPGLESSNEFWPGKYASWGDTANATPVADILAIRMIFAAHSGVLGHVFLLKLPASAYIAGV